MAPTKSRGVVRRAAALVLLLACTAGVRADTAAPLEGTLLDGERVEIALSQPASAGPSARSLLIFWASWCPTCMREIPQLKALQERYDPRVRFIGVNVNKTVQDGLDVHLEQALPYPSLADPDLAIADRFGVQGTPTLVLLDAQGREVMRTHRLSEQLLQSLAAAGS
ncbi:MAG: TlpA disulfide reductase family protein [Halioglobus sp.]|nr:TlpA disulfide reductase family protein [Halioglobus sp.]